MHAVDDPGCRSFHYPWLGPGQMRETVQARSNAAGTPVVTEAEVASIKHDGHAVTAAWINRGEEAGREDAVLAMKTNPSCVRIGTSSDHGS